MAVLEVITWGGVITLGGRLIFFLIEIFFIQFITLLNFFQLFILYFLSTSHIKHRFCFDLHDQL